MAFTTEKTSQVPYKERLLEPNGFLTNAWENFFRWVFDSVNPLGKERSFQISTNSNGSTMELVDLNFDSEKVNYAHSEFIIQRLYTGGTDNVSVGNFLAYFRPKFNGWNLAGSTEAFSTVFTMANNQTSPANITGLNFDTVAALAPNQIDYLIERRTTGSGATTLTESGTLYIKEELLGYSLIPVKKHWPNNAGVTFSITGAGQLRYVSTNITGTASISRITFKLNTLDLGSGVKVLINKSTGQVGYTSTVLSGAKQVDKITLRTRTLAAKIPNNLGGYS